MRQTVSIQARDPWLSYTARLVKITAETPGVATYDFVFDDTSQASSYRCLPGQFNMLYVPGVGEAAISLSGMSEQVLHHTIREAGNVTNSIAQLKPGMNVGLRGPFGSNWPLDACFGKDIILAAGGIGLAPLRPVIHAVLAQPQRYGKLVVLHGARTPSGLLFKDQYDAWRLHGVQVETIVDRADVSWQGQVGVITQLLDRLQIGRPSETVVMSCGPEIMMHFVSKTALARGMSMQNIWLSLERHMNCAIGLCGHCQLGPTFVCKDGPVYRYDYIAPLMKVEGL
jgi:NAD(P)H-flavin reductase